MFGDGTGHLGKGAWMEHIIVIEKRNPFMPGKRKRPIGRSRNTGLSAQPLDPDPRIRNPLQHIDGLPGCGAIIYHTKFPVPVALANHRFNGFPKMVRIGIVHGHENTEAHLPIRTLDSGSAVAFLKNRNLPLIEKRSSASLGKPRYPVDRPRNASAVAVFSPPAQPLDKRQQQSSHPIERAFGSGPGIQTPIEPGEHQMA
jgi:hypothetical protein